MKKRFILILILLLVSVFSFSCKGKEEDLNVASIEEASLELEIGRTYTVSVNTEMMENLSFVLSDEDIASYEIENNRLLLKANKIGSAKLDVIYKEQVIDSVDLEVIEEVIYLPIPTGMILLKGVDKEASVKIILTKEGLDDEEDAYKRYIHQYNMPPYATGEARALRSPGRREIGHGALAE
ncbi:MAG: hypothetical protein J6T34_01600, partial [Bacilli bacterium]|nr:hypothetical protein [Bacilli bacterium]